ncbi:lipid-A-disaccharide synthase [Owenweeksia hongkongensis]|uniref:lipid-A-disaccharide synthase n=1 Tax=Owenweeksia hongkongensis TaxID=253245 RepID=UPI003A8D6AF2
MKYYIIAGEASGDLHGANLMRELAAQDAQADFRFWGGDRMQAVGGLLRKHYRDLAFMGFVEVVLNIRTIVSNLKFCKEDIKAYKPDALILIDYPGFNMRIAEWAKKEGIKVIYYISPQIWAWKQNRVHKLKRDVDRMLCILPFEKDFYARFDMEVDFVGHPLIDAIERRENLMPEEHKKDLGLDPSKPVIAILPGSRKQEIQSMLPTMLKAGRKFKDHQLVLAMAPSQDLHFYKKVADLKDVATLSGKTYDLFEIADAALVTSGTATLEAALFEVPEVVCYKGNWISYHIARQLIKVNYISLVNLIADKEVVKEMIQADMNVSKLQKELEKCISNKGYFTEEYKKLKELLGGPGASQRAAKIIVEEVGA